MLEFGCSGIKFTGSSQQTAQRPCLQMSEWRATHHRSAAWAYERHWERNKGSWLNETLRNVIRYVALCVKFAVFVKYRNRNASRTEGQHPPGHQRGRVWSTHSQRSGVSGSTEAWWVGTKSVGAEGWGGGHRKGGDPMVFLLLLYPRNKATQAQQKAMWASEEFGDPSAERRPNWDSGKQIYSWK